MNLEGLELGQGWNKGLKKKGYCMICKNEMIIWRGEKWINKYKTCSKKCKIEAIKKARAEQIFTEETKLKQSLARQGKRLFPYTIAKISGSNHYNWKGGNNNPLKILRASYDYKKWQKGIIQRDNKICDICKIKKEKVWADHIKPFALYPKLRFDLGNGRTICVDCALRLPTHGNRVYQFKEK